MLSDDFIAFVGGVGREMSPPQYSGYQHIAERIRTAPKFVLQRDAVLVVHNIAESVPSRWLAALPLCRLPYSRMFVEFAYADRAIWMNAAIERGLKVTANEAASDPVRPGFYLETVSDHLIRAQPIWRHGDIKRKNHVSMTHLSLDIDTNPVMAPMSARRAAQVRANYSEDRQAAPRSVYTQWTTDPREVEAALDLENRLSIAPPPYFGALWNELLLLGKHDEASHRRVAQVYDLAQFDLLSEWRFVLALLLTLNSRNIIDLTPEVDYSKVNKNRIRNGIAPLMAHREIRLSLSRVQRNRLGPHGAAHAIHRHDVRGHLKLRKTGIFWWHPFQRGASGDAATPRYSVTT